LSSRQAGALAGAIIATFVGTALLTTLALLFLSRRWVRHGWEAECYLPAAAICSCLAAALLGWARPPSPSAAPCRLARPGMPASGATTFYTP